MMSASRLPPIPSYLHDSFCDDCQAVGFAILKGLNVKVVRHKGLLALSNLPSGAPTSIPWCQMCQFLLQCVQDVNGTGKASELLSNANDEANGSKALHLFVQVDLRTFEISHVTNCNLLSVQGCKSRSSEEYNSCVAKSTGSETSLELAQHWFNNCISHHQHCSYPEEVVRIGGETYQPPPVLSHLDRSTLPLSYSTTKPATGKWNSGEKVRIVLPTRLVYVGSNNSDLRLCLSTNLTTTVQYATLSHCWGQVQTLRLTNSNLTALRHTISFTDLCKTFQDAVQFTRRLNLEYIWIDSLCIVQDDESDWTAESTLMSQVYGSSTINIAASGAMDGNEGLFFDRAPFTVQKFRFSVTSPGIAGVASSVELWEQNPYINGIVRSPLGQRSWAFQERFLPRRTLYFGATQLFWECNEQFANETHPFGCISSQSKEYSWSGKRIRELATQIFTEPLQLWVMLVEEFSQGLLTKPADKLVAISGVAKWFQKRYGGRYLGGLWLEKLEAQLLWRVASGKRPLLYRAPSWSWASLDGRVQPPDKFHASLSRHRGLLFHIQILEVETTPLSSDPFGRLLKGHIRLRCGNLVVEYHKYHERQQTSNHVTYSGCRLDEETQTDVLDSTCYYLAIREETSYSVSLVEGLILKVANKSGKFRRVGHFVGQSTVFFRMANIPDQCAKSEMYEPEEFGVNLTHPHSITII